MRKYKQLPMTNWYRPGQLLDTAKRTVISTLVGEYADPRSGMPDPNLYLAFDYSKHLKPSRRDFEIDRESEDRQEIWIDYAADVGDGFNPTYAVAYSLAQPELQVAGVDRPLPRGEILLFGGDGVYPTANSERYENQLVTPYRMAFKAGRATGRSPLVSELAENPHVFALPGNHDWYDSLVAFKQLFCSHIFNGRRFADDPTTGSVGWRTRQRRSYFTLKLPNNWWLLGVDLQLNHNIDVGQLAYFDSVVSQMDPGDKIILCVPEPYWEKAIKYQDVTDKYEEKEKSIKQLDWYFQNRGVEVRAFIAGDLHHYRHFQDRADVHKITAGGGGAFLHPTHDFKFARSFEEIPPERQHPNSIWLEGEYPSHAESRSMGWRDLGFLFHNWRFGIMTAVIYSALALLVHGRITGPSLAWTDDDFWWRAIKTTVDRAIDEPLVILVVALLLIGLVFFTDSESKTYKRRAGGIHGLAHLIAAFVFGWLAYAFSIWLATKCKVPIPPEHLSTRYNLIWFFSVLLISGLGGYVIGSFIMGIYLYISLHFFGRHSNEAFSALKIQDYKNFLRMHIDSGGVLTIYPIKIERVPRRKGWIDKGDYYAPTVAIQPELIEKVPIVVR